MGIAFALLFNKQVLGGLSFHEWTGTIIGGAFLAHIALNWRWVKNMTLKLFDRKMPALTRFGYILNVLLLISMTTIIVSGVFISRILFPGMNVGDQAWFKVTHISLSFVTLITVGVHIGLHWKWVMTVVQRLAPSSKGQVWLSYIAKAAAILILVFGVYEMNQTSFVQRVSSAVSIVGGGSQMGMGGRPSFEGEKGERVMPDEDAAEGQEGRPEGRAGFEGGFRGGQEGHGGSANAFQVLATYFGILAVFVVIVYYLEKLWSRRKKKLKLG
nr:DUF4405 domain-containing protein [Paenibacillus phyllosphaerae]